MTFHFNEFDAPAALDDKKLEEITGCPINKSIESVCREPGCPNNPAERTRHKIQEEDCLQQNEAFDVSAPVWLSRSSRTGQDSKQEIYQTEPKNRCVM